jgi:hypothetical protein
MLICGCCGKLKDEDSVDYMKEDYGELLPHYECDCGGEFEVARRCRLCGELFYDPESFNVCNSCMEESACNTAYALKIGVENEDSVAVNGFIAYALDNGEINEILMSYIKEHSKELQEKAKGYCLDDKYHFSDWIIDRKKMEKETIYDYD